MHDPNTPDLFKDGVWDFTNNNGPQYCTFDLSTEKSAKIIPEVTFTNCDFKGKSCTFFLFKNCNFKFCDFGLSTFRKAKFTNCTFEKTSFTQATFFDCEFRDCKFKEIGVSGNSTILEKTLITNPRDFIRSAFTNTENLPKGKTKIEQKAKLEETKSTISRIILYNLSKEGSERTFYEAIKANNIQESKSKIWMSCFNIYNSAKNSKKVYKKSWEIIANALSLTGGIIDIAILYIFGSINSWGASLARPAIFGFLVALCYAQAYQMILQIDLQDALRRSIEIMLLFGYTSYSSKESTYPLTALMLSNALLGVAWYVVMVPTIVNKLTRVRS